MRSVISFLLLLNFKYIASALRHSVNTHLAWNESFTLSESYMFSTENGPAIMEQGKSYIELDTSVLITTKVNISPKVKFAIFSCDEINSRRKLDGICDKNVADKNDWIGQNSNWIRNVRLFWLLDTTVLRNLNNRKTLKCLLLIRKALIIISRSCSEYLQIFSSLYVVMYFTGLR
jgi:hypothetical protein